MLLMPVDNSGRPGALVSRRVTFALGPAPHPIRRRISLGYTRHGRSESCPDVVFVGEVRPRLPACNAHLKETFYSSCPRAKVGEF